MTGPNPALGIRMRLSALAARLGRDEGGAAAIEFAIVAPVFITLLIGALDMGQTVYAKSILNGAVEQAARKSSLEGGKPADADKMVEDMVKRVLPGVRISSTRKSYFDFADIQRAEKVIDDNNNNLLCDSGEHYRDENKNGKWDADIGLSGNGGANDVIIYTVTAKYQPIFKIPFMPAMWNERTLTTSTVRKNQPFAAQTGYATTGSLPCPIS